MTQQLEKFASYPNKSGPKMIKQVVDTILFEIAYALIRFI